MQNRHNSGGFPITVTVYFNGKVDLKIVDLDWERESGFVFFSCYEEPTTSKTTMAIAVTVEREEQNEIRGNVVNKDMEQNAKLSNKI